jgi:beta-lactamase regulating signal transducer with metallopeptidase domain
MTMNNELFSLCERLLTALLNSAYQGVLLAMLVWVALRWFVRTNAATRHAVWFCALLLVTSLVGIHIFREFHGNGISSVSDVAQANAADATPFPEITIFEPSIVSDTGDSYVIAGDSDTPESSAGYSIVGDFVANPNPPTSAPGWSNISTAALTLSSPPTLGQKIQRVAARFLVPLAWTITLERGIGSFAIVSALACLIGLGAFRVLYLLIRLREIRILKRQSLPPDVAANELFLQLLALSGVKRGVSLRMSPAIASPVLLGFVHPVILVSPQDTPEELKQVLRHELAHVARRDDWANLFQQFIQAILFFHPAVWWISRRLSLEREIACDDHVLQQGSNARSYALLLTNLAGRMQASVALPQLAPGVSNKTSQLKQRIAMLLDTKRNRSPRLAATRLGIIASGATILAIAAIFAGPRIVFGQSVPVPPLATASVNVAPAAPAAANTLTAPVAVIAATAPEAASLPIIGSGPRLKTAQAYAGADNDPGQPLPVAPVPRVPEIPAVAAVVPHAPHAPHPVRSGPNDSLEQRLDRLEKAVQALLESTKQKPGAGLWTPKPDPYNFNFNWDRKELERNKELSKSLADMQKEKSRAELNKQWALVDPKSKMELKEFAKRETDRASEEVRRAGREAEKAMAEQKRNMRSQLRQSSKMQLDALRKQLDALEHQKENLHREIERLEREHSKGGSDQDGSDTDDADEADSSADSQ